MKKNPTTIFIQLLRAKTSKNKIKKQIQWKKKHEKGKKKIFTLMWLQVKPLPEIR